MSAQLSNIVSGERREYTESKSGLMKAVRIHEFGGPEVLRYEDAPMPVLMPGEVLVQVHAVGINPPDWYLREGLKMLPPDWRPAIPLPVIPGTDVSGVVVAAVEDVKTFATGDAMRRPVPAKAGYR